MDRYRITDLGPMEHTGVEFWLELGGRRYWVRGVWGAELLKMRGAGRVMITKAIRLTTARNVSTDQSSIESGAPHTGQPSARSTSNSPSPNQPSTSPTGYHVLPSFVLSQ